jgi:hypothetical protein
MNIYEINDSRLINDFKNKTFSKYLRSKVKLELLNNLYNSKMEPACYWSVELICAGHFQDLWEIILLYMSRYIQLGNPKLPLYIEIRFQSFKKIISNGYIGNELMLRNNEKIRKLFAEIICILCISRKKHAFESLSIKDPADFEITNLTRRLKAPNISFVESIYKKDDPKELFIAINEFAYQISSLSKDITSACYWLEWILQFEILCKQKKLRCSCERRVFAPVNEKLQMDIIWIIWDTLIQQSLKFDSELYNKIIISLLNLFSIKYTNGCKKKRKYIIYLAISLLTENVNFNIKLIENRKLTETITNKINIIYKEVKKNEIAPQTDYLFLNVEKSNLDKTVEKLEKLNNIDTINHI